MYYQISLKELVNLVRGEITGENCRFPILTNKDIEQLKNLAVDHLSAKDLAELSQFIQKTSDEYSHPKYYTNPVDSKKMHIVMEITKWNSLLKVDYSDLTKWKENFHLLTFFNTDEKVENLRSITSSLFNEKVDIVSLDLSGSDMVSMKDMHLLNKAINTIYEDLSVEPEQDRTIVIESELSLSEVKGKLESATEYYISADDLISDKFYHSPINLQTLKKVSAEFLGKDVVNVYEYSLDEKLVRSANNPNLVEAFEIIKEMEPENFKSSSFVSAYLKYATSVVKNGSEESSLVTIKTRAISYFENRKTYPLVKMEDIPLDVLLDDKNIDLYLNYIAKKSSVKYKEIESFNVGVNLSSFALGFLVEFMSKNNNFKYSKDVFYNNKSYISFNFEERSDYKVIANIITHVKEKSLGILTYLMDFNKVSVPPEERKALLDTLRFCIDLKYGEKQTPLSEISDTLSLLSNVRYMGSMNYGNSNDEKFNTLKKLVLLYSDEDIMSNGSAINIFQKIFCSERYFNELKPERYFELLSQSFNTMFRNYLNGSTESKDNVLFLLDEKIKDSHSILHEDSLSKKFIIMLTAMESSMEKNPIIYHDKSYSKVLDLMNGINHDPNSTGREIILSSCVSYISQVEKHFVKKSRDEDKYPSFITSMIPHYNLAKLYETINARYEKSTSINNTYKDKEGGIVLNDVAFQSIFNLLGHKEYKKVVNDFVDLVTTENISRHFYKESIDNMGNIKERSDILLTILNNFKVASSDEKTGDVIRDISKTWNKKDWDYVSLNLDSVNNFRGMLGSSLVFKDVNFDLVSESAFANLLGNANKVGDLKNSFTKEQLAHPFVSTQIIKQCNTMNIIDILGKAELLKPFNLLLVAEKVTDGKENIGIFKNISLELGEYIENTSLKPDELLEHFKIVFNTIILDESIPKNKRSNKLLKM